MYKKILVPLDGSPLAETAIRHAHALAKSLNSSVTLFRVVVFPTRDFDVIPMEGAVSREVSASAKRYLEHVAGSIRRTGVTVNTDVGSGRVADAIIDYAAKNEIDLIVMSTHGRSGAARWLIGSVAEQVVNRASVPVFLVRTRNGNSSSF